MAHPETIKRIRKDLRISHNSLDSDISDQIDSCLADLKKCGVRYPRENDKNIITAIKLWCRSFYDTDEKARSQYYERYNSFKASLMYAKGYGGKSNEE